MNDVRTIYVMHAFIAGWIKNWSCDYTRSCVANMDDYEDKFKSVIMNAVQGKSIEDRNKAIAELFGEVVTQVKAFPTDNGWIILDRHTKRLLHKDVKNENEVNLLCKKNGYVR